MQNTSAENPAVAIVGISCIFAESPDAKAFLRVLTRGIDAVTDPPHTHRHLCDYYDPDPKKPDHIYCHRGGFLPRVDFDPAEFGIPPAALEATDTSQLLGLLVAKRALEDAGYGRKGKAFDRTRTSVILGITGTQELVIPLGARLGHPIWRKALFENGIPDSTADAIVENIADRYVAWQENSFPGLLGNVVAGRIANRLNLGGTNCVVDAACASSMSAIHMALLELCTGRSDMVLSGGVDTINDAFMHMCFSKSRILSSSGDIRPFSQEADGTVLGEGVGIIVLKRLADARRDGDRVYAVIRGLGSASDGKSQSIYAPRVEGQAAALRRAYQNAGVQPESIELLEAHGTGTRVGDQVEFKALCDVFGGPAAKTNHCALGSVKSNIGHTKAAAGTAGLIKAALSIYHKVLPPTLKALPSDTKLGVADSPFYLNHSLRPWTVAPSCIRRAGVSAFGFGGSNFHAVLEEHDSQKLEPSWDGSIEIAAFSDATREALAHRVNEWAGALTSESPAHEIGRLAAQSRRRYDVRNTCRLVMVLPTGDPDGVRRSCRAAVNRLKSDADDENGPAGPIFIGRGAPDGGIGVVFPGQGSQYVGMGRDLICCFADSLEAFQSAEPHFHAPYPLHEYIYPRLPGNNADYEARLRKTDIAQPAIGAVSLAMAEALTYFGITPEAFAGHSFGELVALHAAGRIDREAFWKLSVARGQLMARAGESGDDPGSMLAVQAPLQELAQLAESLENVVLANRNSPMQGVLSGTTAAIESTESVCRQKGWKVVRLPVAAAFHSDLVASARIPFQKMVQKIRWRSDGITVMSNTSGQAYPADASAAKRLLGAQLAQPVDFVSNIERMHESGIRTFLEVGPKTLLTGLIGSILKDRPFHTLALDHSAGREFGLRDLANTLAQLAALGYPVLLDRWEKATPPSDAPRMRIPLCGANYRREQERPQKRAVAAGVAKRRSPEATKPAAIPPIGNRAATPAPTKTTPPTQTAAPQGLQSEQDRMNTTPFLAQALAAVQQGLSSLQALQSQTTQAHQKYLEAQAQANLTLQQMIQQTQHLAATAMGDPSALSQMDFPKQASQAHEHASMSQQGPMPPQPAAADSAAPLDPMRLQVQKTLENAPTAASVMPQSGPSAIQAGNTNAPPSERQTTVTSGSSQIQQALIEIVSRLTGYPEELLGPQMDIESDLGIDSIKRVEILSALEEQMPQLPRVTPDMVGSLKTLGQICDYLGANGAAAPLQTPVATAAAPPSGPGASTSGSSQIQQALIEIVSRLTGYPEEMLGPQMDIESDLGIDSIKRVEILSALEEQMPQLPRVTPDMVGSLKTLGQICDYLSGNQQEGPEISSCPSAAESHAAAADPICQAVARYEVRPVPLAQSKAGRFLPAPDHQIGILSGDPQWGQMIAEALNHLNCPTKILNDATAVSSLDRLAGLVICAPIAPWNAFECTQKCAPLLEKAARSGQALFFTVTRLDGAFGLNGCRSGDPEQGALAGLVKTAALEWPSVRCRALDIDSAWPDLKAAAQAAALEVVEHIDDPDLEVGLGPDGRTALQLVPVDVMPTAPLRLEADDVVIVTGGARGVTAAAALALADHTPCTVALFGRSAPPEAEPDWLAPLHEEAQIKQAILKRTDKGGLSPRKLETAYRKWMANRDVLRTLEAFDIRGIRALYYQLDVRSTDEVAATLAYIRQEVGPIKALIHGAGVLEDRLIKDKKHKQFQVVYDTKVKGLIALLEAMDSDPLQYLVLFSSISARMGNPGQADYAMANEALNKLAARQASRKPECKVVSINWGPWDGGMVTPLLKRNFEKNGIQLIPIRLGAAAMVEEMKHPRNNRVEVVIGTPLQPGLNGGPLYPAEAPPAVHASDGPEMAMTQNIQREIDTERCPILQSHLLDGRPVVPLALITEWLAHSALHSNPGLVLHGIDHLRLLKGIALDRRKKTIRLMAGSPKRNGQLYEVDVEVRDGAHNGAAMVHSRARAILADRLPDAPPFKENGHFRSTSGLRPLNEIYDQILFHGEALRGIQEIIRLSGNAMTAHLRCAPAPEKWLNDPMRSRWIADPLVLDCAFQMAIIWCYEQQGQVCLPSYAESYRQYRDRFPDDGVIAVLDVTNATDRKMIADITFLDRNKSVIARMSGYEAVMDPGLLKAFGVKAA